MRHRHVGCGPRGHIEIQVPEALLAMRGRGWQGNWGPFHFDFGDEGWSGGRRGRRARRMFESGELRLVLLKLIADESRHGVLTTYHTLRQQMDKVTGEPCYALSDFVAPKDTGLPDFIGAFAVTTGVAVQAH